MKDFPPQDYADFGAQLWPFSKRVREIRAMGFDVVDARRLTLAEAEIAAHAEDEARAMLLDEKLRIERLRANAAWMEGEL